MQALQHRGQCSAGIALYDQDNKLYIQKGNGLVTEVLTPDKLARLSTTALKSTVIIGHDRYSTSGGVIDPDNSSKSLAQPFGSNSRSFALSHNGHIEDIWRLADMLEIKTNSYQSDSACLTEILDQMSTSDTLLSSLHNILPLIQGSYSLVISQRDSLIGVRDPRGYRPLSIAKTADGNGYLLASETIAFDMVGAKFLRDVNPGEIVIIDKTGLRSEELNNSHEIDERFCMFEFVYFAHPNSNIRGRNVYQVREKLGRLLAEDHPIEADMVVGVQNSGSAYARGYSRQSGIAEELAITKNPYVQRTFISNNGYNGQLNREQSVRLKHQVNKELVEGKRIIVIDDSIIRSTTIKVIVSMLKLYGAKEIHIRIPSPPYAWPCYYGMDTAEINELIANNHTKEEICQEIGADSLEFLSLDRLIEGINLSPSPNKKSLSKKSAHSLCTSCITGQYPVSIPLKIRQLTQCQD